jgi:hypothetical protein
MANETLSVTPFYDHLIAETVFSVCSGTKWLPHKSTAIFCFVQSNLFQLIT